MRLVLCDDNRILCEALATIFQARGHIVLAIATSVVDSIAVVEEHRPDACLIDLCFPDGSGLDAVRAIRRNHPETRILVLSCLLDPVVVAEAKRIGVAGFLRKDQKPDAIARALEAVDAGRTVFATAHQAGRRTVAPTRQDKVGGLTPREAEVLRRIVAGQSTRQMSSEMNVAVSTLRGYVKSILAKLGVHSRLEAAAIASSHQYHSVA